MGGYIGARSGVGLVNTTLGSVQDLTATDASPEVTLINNTHEDSDGGRESKVIFKGQQSGGEESTLAEIQASHDGTADDEAGDLIFRTNDGSDGASPTEAMRIDKDSAITASRARNNTAGNCAIIVSPSDTTASYGFRVDQTNNNFNIDKVNTAETLLSISNNGKVMVGKTSDDNSVDGVLFDPAGMVKTARANSICAIHNRRSSDGEIMQFRKDDSTVGKLRTDGGKFGIEASDANGLNIWINGGNEYSFDGVRFYPLTNGTNDLGLNGFRFRDIYATNGTISTSDKNEKQNIASLTSAEITAATAISKLFKTFKWKDAVAEKGDNARTHAGVIAQQVETAMSNAGLDASKYAFWCSNTWWETQTEVAAVEADEENGIEAQDAYTRTDTYQTKEEAPKGATERTEMGVRYHELLAFIGAATEQRLTSIEARLTALEAE